MLPAPYDITQYRGDTFRRIFKLRIRNDDGTLGDYADLTDCIPLAQIRTTDVGATLLQTFNCTVLDQTLNKGSIRAELTPSQTKDLPKRSMWDLQLTHPNGDVHTYLAGKFTSVGQTSYLGTDGP